jgi:hypothetical protein
MPQLPSMTGKAFSKLGFKVDTLDPSDPVNPCTTESIYEIAPSAEQEHFIGALTAMRVCNLPHPATY